MKLPIILPIGSDGHSGSSTGILPPEWKLENGNNISWNESHDVSWKQWMADWQTVKLIRKDLSVKGKIPKIVTVANGDWVDGEHHGTTQLVTNKKPEQARIAAHAWDEGLAVPGFDVKKDKMYMVKGTGVHVDDNEEIIARDLTDPKTGKSIVIPEIKPTPGIGKDGKYIHDTLKLRIHGKLIFFAHKIFGVGKREWTKENGIYNLLKSFYFQSLNEERECPDLFVSSHFHQYAHGIYPGRNKTIRGIVTPALQTKTHYGNSVAPYALSDIGMIILVVYPNGKIEIIKDFAQYDESKEYKE